MIKTPRAAAKPPKNESAYITLASGNAERKKKMKNRNEIERVKSEVNPAKERLMRAADELREIGEIRESNSLETIIEKLEIWQNK